MLKTTKKMMSRMLAITMTVAAISTVICPKNILAVNSSEEIINASVPDVSFTEETMPTFSISTVQANAGQIVPVTMSLTNNPNWSSGRFQLFYDLDLTPVMKNAEAQIVMTAKGIDNDLSMNTILRADLGLIVFTCFGATENQEDGAVVSTAFQIPEDAQVGTVYDLDLVVYEFTRINPNAPGGQRLESKAVNGSIEIVEETVTQGYLNKALAEQNSLTITSLNQNVKVSCNESEAAHASSNAAVATINEAGVVSVMGNGTAMITITGEGFTRYLMINVQLAGLVGDVNGDGVVDASDASAIAVIAGCLAVGGSYELNADTVYIADLNNDGFVDATDATAVASLAGISAVNAD